MSKRALFVLRAGLGSLAVALLLGATPPLDAEPRACVERDACCKVCRKGKACGDSCISRRFDCHQGAGCACDEDDLCP